MKCIAAVPIVLGMTMTAGATSHAPRTRAPIYEPHRVYGQSSGKISIAAKRFGERALKNTYILCYLVPGIRVPDTSMCILYFKASPYFAASYSYGNFLMDWDRLPSTVA